MRIVSAHRRLVGMGYLVAPDTVVTCARVVADALGCREEQREAPGGTVRLDRPLSGLPGDKSDYQQAQVLRHGWYPACAPGTEPEHGLADIAVLQILEQPYGHPAGPRATGPGTAG